MMAEQYLRIGDGERFEPTDEEIVGHYLYRKVMGGGGGGRNNKGLLKLSRREASRVPEADLYAEEPWDIWSNLSGGSQDVYLYTRLQPRKTGGGHVSRRVGTGAGTWHGEDIGSEISVDMLVTVKGKCGSRSNTRITAMKKRFNYRNPKNSEESKRWILHEYSCTSVAGDGVTDRSWVVCRLRKNPLLKRHRHCSNYTPPLSVSGQAPSSDSLLLCQQDQQQSTSSVSITEDEILAPALPWYNVGHVGNHDGNENNNNNNNKNMFMASNTGLGSAIRGSEVLGIVTFYRDEESSMVAAPDQNIEQAAGGGELEHRREAAFPDQNIDPVQQFLLDSLDLSDPPSWPGFN